MNFRTKQEEKKLDFNKYNRDQNVQNANNADRNKKVVCGLGILALGKTFIRGIINIGKTM